MLSAILGTTAGVYRLSDDRLEPLDLADQRISAIHAWPNPDGTTTVLAGSYGDGLFRSEDGGVGWVQVAGAPSGVLAGSLALAGLAGMRRRRRAR